MTEGEPESMRDLLGGMRTGVRVGVSFSRADLAVADVGGSDVGAASEARSVRNRSLNGTADPTLRREDTWNGQVGFAAIPVPLPWMSFDAPDKRLYPDETAPGAALVLPLEFSKKLGRRECGAGVEASPGDET